MSDGAVMLTATSTDHRPHY